VTAADALAVFLLAVGASSAQALSGFGFSLLIVPPLAVVIGPKEAVVLANLLSPAQNALMLTRLHGHVEWRVGSMLLAGALVGMPLGLALLVAVDPTALKAVIAVTVLVSTVLLWRGLRIRSGNRLGDAVAGFFSGVLNTSTSMSGPPVVLYLQGRALPPDAFRGTLTAYFMIISLIAVALFAIGGRIDRVAIEQWAICLPALAFGLFAGSWVYRLLNARQFRGVVMGVLFASGFIALGSIALR
jgi:uncharacterized membrane protein YfcA